MINSTREWDWMDDCRIHRAIEEAMIEEEGEGGVFSRPPKAPRANSTKRPT